MAPLKNTLLLLAATMVGASAFVTPALTRPATKISESFGFYFAEDTYANQPDFLKGEGEYKTWMGKVKENSFVNRQVSTRFSLACQVCRAFRGVATAVV